ncbi:hypothetical protein CAAN3_08S01904 [[Candida] anglica]
MVGSSRSLSRALDAAFRHWHDIPEEQNARASIVSLNEDKHTAQDDISSRKGSMGTDHTTATNPGNSGGSKANAVAELYQTITDFQDKHKTLTSLKQTMNVSDELLRVYDVYVKPKTNLQKEVFFVEILIRLSPSFIHEENVMRWLDTYLKPAVNSAGYDLQFVTKARKFVECVSAEIVHSEDPLLQARRERMGDRVVERILEVYLGSTSNYNNADIGTSTSSSRSGSVGTSIDLVLDGSEKEINTQEYSERLRYVRMNCSNLVIAYGLKHPRRLFEVLDGNIKYPNRRLGVLSLLSGYASHESSQSYDLVQTELWASLLRIVCYDGYAGAVSMALSIVCMVIPQVCDRVGKYASDLMSCYVRLVGSVENISVGTPRPESKLGSVSSHHNLDERIDDEGNQTKDSETLKDTPGPSTTGQVLYTPFTIPPDWSTLNTSYSQTLSLDHSISYRLQFDTTCLITLLYGLFPFNLAKFSQNPQLYLSRYPSRIVTHISLPASISPTLGPTEVAQTVGVNNFNFPLIGKTLAHAIKSFTLHPNFLQFDHISLLDELKRPIDWLIQSLNGDDLRSEEIALGCLGLNPELIISIPDSLFDQPIAESNGKSYSIGRMASYASYSSRSDLQSSHNAHQYESRGSSVGGPIVINPHTRDSVGVPSKTHFQKYLFNITRRGSLVPSSLVGPTNRGNGVGGDLINFKEVNFNNLNDSRRGSERIVEKSEVDERIGSEAINDPLGDTSQISPPNGLNKDHPRLSESLSDLLTIHEKLYTATKNIPQSLRNGSIYSVASTGHWKDSIGGHNSDDLSASVGTLAPMLSTGSASDGTTIDFYQRELLLMKNELDFSNYMQQLNKFQYAKLKLKMNRLLREPAMHAQAFENKEKDARTKRLEERAAILTAEVERLKKELESSINEGRQELERILQQAQKSSFEKNELKIKLETVQNELLSKSSSLEKLSQILSDKEYQLSQIRLEKLANKPISGPLIQAPPTISTPSAEHNGFFSVTSTPTGNASQPTSVALHNQLYALRTELLIAHEKNRALSHELTKAETQFEVSLKASESQSALLRHELGTNASSYVAQYERKIQDMSATILKYEGLLEQKNAKIVQISTSRPISIPASSIPIPGANAGPSSRSNSLAMGGRHRLSTGTTTSNTIPMGGGPTTSSPMYLDSESKTRSNSSVDSIPSPPPPGTTGSTGISGGAHVPPHMLGGGIPGIYMPPTPPAVPRTNTSSSTNSQQQPIIKGRGGYQKRSKKFM